MSVLLLSGGLDSAVLLASEVNHGIEPICLAIDYGQRHKRELQCARLLADRYVCELVEVSLPAILFTGSALTGGCPVPYGHFAHPVQRDTVVPNRNMVLISLAVSLAIVRGETEVLIAAHAGDSTIYPDCRPAFVEAIDRATRMACGACVSAPFMTMDKRDIVTLGRSLGVPFTMTYSCYEGWANPCGKCGACVERIEAMT